MKNLHFSEFYHEPLDTAFAIKYLDIIYRFLNYEVKIKFFYTLVFVTLEIWLCQLKFNFSICKLKIDSLT